MLSWTIKMTFLLLFVGTFLKHCSGEEGYFWHVTDFHWDFSYWTDALSCHGKNVSNRGLFGNYWCDSPWALVEETVKGMRRIKADVDFILWTGDSVPHVPTDHLSTDINIELIRNITELLQYHFPGIPVYPTLGNNDYYKKDQFPPHNNEFYNATYSLWKTWIIRNDSQEITFLKGGYYTLTTRTGVRVIALNTNMYYKDPLTEHLEDPADQLAWLDDQLTAAASNNEKVLLTGHVPPGYSTPRALLFMFSDFNKKLVEIILNHTDVISAMYFGHEHRDTFKLFYNSSGIPAVPLFVAPSVTPWRYVRPTETALPHNPAVRLIKYERHTAQPLDILQYYVDLPMANTRNHLDWVLGYTATRDYGIPDVSSHSLHNLIKKFQDENGIHFKTYMDWYNTYATKDYPCDERCHKTVICGFTNFRKDMFDQCTSQKARCDTEPCTIIGK